MLMPLCFAMFPCLHLRSMFVDKFLLWKVFPVSCLKWILQFAVHECPPGSSLSEHNRAGLLNTVQRLMAVWSKKEFVQTAPIEQQACILFNRTSILKVKSMRNRGIIASSFEFERVV